MKLKIQTLPYDFTVCKIKEFNKENTAEFTFSAVTDNEISLVCKTENTPDDALSRMDGWRGFRIYGVLDFSLIGILADIAKILADNNVSIFAVSTFDTDYIFVKKENFEIALDALKRADYEIF